MVRLLCDVDGYHEGACQTGALTARQPNVVRFREAVFDEVTGRWMMGGGFGGDVVCLAEKRVVDPLAMRIVVA